MLFSNTHSIVLIPFLKRISEKETVQLTAWTSAVLPASLAVNTVLQVF